MAILLPISVIDWERIKKFRSILSLSTLGHPEEKAYTRILKLEQRVYLGSSVLQGLILTAVFTKYRSTGRTTTRDFISSDSTPKNKTYISICYKI